MPRIKTQEDAFKNKFITPLDFEMLDSTIPYYQAGLGHRLCYEITFNDYGSVIRSTPAKPSGNASASSPDATYKISNISLNMTL